MGRWTYSITPKIQVWVKCGRRLDYFVTQFLTEHGCFKNYSHRIRKDENNICEYCSEEDSQEHTILKCEIWNEERRKVNIKVQGKRQGK